MKKSTTYVRAVQNLNKIFDAINVEFCGGELEKPTITIQSSQRSFAHVSISKVWKNAEGKESRELNVSADYLMTEERALENVVASVAHECAHIWNMMHGIQDVSKNGYYHNRLYKKTACEIFHLDISYHPQYGNSITAPTFEILELIDKYSLQPILINRDGETGYQPTATGKAGATITKITGKKKQNSIRYHCPTCGAIARTTRETNLICGDCMEKMIR